MKTIKDVVIVAYGRSPIGRESKGTLASEVPTKIAAEVLNGVLARVPNLDPELIDDVMIGCATPEDVQGLNVARAIIQRADNIPDRVPAQTIDRFGSSGLQSIASAANAIMASEADIVVAGGVESMSMLSLDDVIDPNRFDPYLVKNRPGVYTPMGLTAELVAEKQGVTRKAMDEFAFKSETKADAAQKAGAFKKEIIPVTYLDNDGHKQTFSEDECIHVSPLDALAQLRPEFKNDGSCTAANSAQAGDGAAFVVLMSADKAKELDIKPIAKFLGYQVEGVSPSLMGMGPVAAVPKLLKKLDMKIGDFDTIEIDEAFAAQVVPCIKELGVNPDKVNPRGGAIALGQPLGAAGTILTCKVLSYLEDTKGKYGIVTLCVDGGMGAASAFEML